MAAPCESAFMKGKLVEFPTPTGQNVLSVAMIEGAYDTLFSKEEEEKTIRLSWRNRPDIIICEISKIRIEGDGGVPGDTSFTESSLALYCTKHFTRCFNCNFGDSVILNEITLYPLAKVVLAANTRNSFHWANQQSFSTALLLAACKKRVIISKGYPVQCPQSSMFARDPEFHPENFLNLVVLDCEPLSIGMLNVNTEVTIIDQTQTQEKLLDDVHEADTTSITELSLFPKLSDFCHPLIQNCGNPSDLDVRIITNQQQWFSILNKSTHSFDPLHTVCINKATAKCLNLFNESLVTLNPYTEGPAIDTRHETKPRVTVLTIADSCESGFLYLTPLLAFYLNLKGSNMRVSLQAYVGNWTNTCSSDVSMSVMPCIPYATEVTLSLVNSPHGSHNDSYDKAIEQYFSVPRVVNEGDVICSWTEGTGTYDKGVVHYKVVSVISTTTDSKCYLADIEHTTVYQKRTVNSYIPIHMVEFYNGKEDSILPRPLAECSKKIVDMLLPCIQSKDQSVTSVLLSGPIGSGKSKIIQSISAQLNIQILQVNCHDLNSESVAATEARIKNSFNAACRCSPSILVLNNVEVIGKDAHGDKIEPRVSSSFNKILAESQDSSYGDFPMVAIATTSSAASLSSDVLDGFLHSLEIQAFSEGERLDVIKWLLEGVPHSLSVNVTHMAQRTAGFVLADLESLLFTAKKIAYDKVIHTCFNGKLTEEDEDNLDGIDVVLTGQDFDKAIDQLQTSHTDTIGAPKIPSVKWEDVGGLVDVKADILDTIQLPLLHPELFAQGLRRSGVLLYGPPGTGKTLLAKAVATECSLNFMSVKGPELINMYVGQSEENVREVFKRARLASPCVIFFDELDSLAPYRGRTGDSAGVMDRVVSQLLAELDGLHTSCDVFVIGATNRPDLLDPALLRPGRFDKLLFLGVSSDSESKLKILKALTRKFALSKDCDLSTVADLCPANLTGADIYALCADAMMNAMKKTIADSTESENPKKTTIKVCQNDFELALENVIPSLSERELNNYSELQQTLALGTLLR